MTKEKKMNPLHKNVLYIILTILMLSSIVLSSASAALPVHAWTDTKLVVDQADLLTAEEEEALLTKLEQISADTQMDVVVVTAEDTYGKTPMMYADDFYDYNGYASSGMLLLVDIGNSKWHLSTAGDVIPMIGDAELDYMSDQFVGYLSNGEFYNAFDAYADLAEECIVNDGFADVGIDDGDTVEEYQETFPLVRNLAISLFMGLLIAGSVTMVMRTALKSVRGKAEAQDYVKPGSLQVTNRQDIYLYRHVDRIPKPKQSDSGSHISSSGNSHGGGGGSF